MVFLRRDVAMSRRQEWGTKGIKKLRQWWNIYTWGSRKQTFRKHSNYKSVDCKYNLWNSSHKWEKIKRERTGGIME